MNDIHDAFSRQGLVRPRSGRVLGGVCAGLGRCFGLDPWPARLLFVLVLMVICGKPGGRVPDPVDPHALAVAARGARGAARVHLGATGAVRSGTVDAWAIETSRAASPRISPALL